MNSFVHDSGPSERRAAEALRDDLRRARLELREDQARLAAADRGSPTHARFQRQVVRLTLRVEILAQELHAWQA